MGEAMSTVQQTIEVSAPLHTVYEQLSTFESYPRFMTGVEQVIQTSSNETHWIMDLDGRRREFDARIIENSLDERVSWSTVDGPLLAETITLRPVGETRTQVVAQMEADLAFLMPSDRHGQETLNRRLKADLASFKKLIEHQGFAGDSLLSGTGTIMNVGASSKARPATAFGSSGPAHLGAGSGGPGGMTPDGRATDANLNLSSPAAVAARATRNRNHAVSRDRTAMMGNAVDITSAPGITDPHDLDDVLAPGAHLTGTRMGGAGMGGQAMSRNDSWGDGMINEEERGSAHDL
jgi:carbon monoxide dehydrogenase subunit G